MTAREEEVLRKAIWDAIDRRIEQEPVDGINAEGQYSRAVQINQLKFVDGMRSARLSALAALSLKETAP